jgi:hypothetical protein
VMAPFGRALQPIAPLWDLVYTSNPRLP